MGVAGYRLGKGTYVGYAFGAVGTAGFGTVPGLVLSIYLTNTLGVAAAIASLVVLVPKLWDVVFLPFVGRMSDHSAARRGSRRPFLLIGALGMIVSFPLMFAVPEGVLPDAAAVWVLITFLICASVFAFFQVPYIATAAEITDNTAERTTMMSWRVGFQAGGILLFGLTAPLIRDQFNKSHLGYLVMGIVVGAAIGLGMLVCWWALRRTKRYVVGESAERASLLDQFRMAWQVRSFRFLLGAFIVQALATGAVLAGIAYFSIYVLDVQDYSIVFGVLVVPAVIVMPLWSWVGHRWGKRAGFLASSVIFIIGLLSALLAERLTLAVALALIGVAAVGYAGMQMFPLAMLPDTIAADAAVTGRQRAGAFTGVWTAGETAAFAVGPALFLLVLAVGGFVSSTDNTAVQPQSAIVAINVGFAVLPALLVALSLPLIAKWRESEQRQVAG